MNDRLGGHSYYPQEKTLKTGLIVAGVLAGFVALWSVGSYNGMVGLDENVNQTYAQVQNVLQRQAELIPNLVETVKGYAAHESGTFQKVTEARNQIAAVAKVDPRELANNPDLQRQVIDAQKEIGQALVRLTATREAYPDLKANTQFTTLMAELAGSINRVTVERRKNQIAVQEYNQAVRVFPRVVFASLFGFKTKPYYEAAASSQTAPTVKF